MSSTLEETGLAGTDTDRSALQGAGIGTWHILAGENSVCVNTRWCEIHGIASQYVSTTLPLDMWWIRVHPDDLAALKNGIHSLLDNKTKNVDIAYRVRHRDGHWQQILTRGSAVNLVDNDQPVRFSGIDIDVGTLFSVSNDDDEFQDKTNRLDFASDSSQQGNWHIDYSRGIKSENDTWRTMRGYSADSHYHVNSEEWKNDVHPEDYERVTPDKSLCNGIVGDIIDATYRQRHANGHWLWIWTHGRIIEKDAQGSPVRIIATDTDVTPIKEAELRYDRLSNTLDLAMQAAEIGVWEWPINSKGNYWDQRTRDMFGIKNSDAYVPDTQFRELVHEEDREALNKELEATLANYKDMSVNYRINHPEKGIRHIKSRAKFHNVNGDDPRYVGIVWDITETLQKEQELENARNLINEVLEQMDQGLAMFRGPTMLQAKRIIANQNFYNLLELPEHFSSGELSLRGYVEHLLNNQYFIPQPQASAEELLAELSDSDVTVFTLATPSGRTLRSIGSSIGGNSRIVTFTDITDMVDAERERSELNDRLNHAERLRSVGELTGGIAHDFNNLLAVISGSAELLSIRLEEENKLVNAISSAAHRGAELTQALLAFSRKQALQPTTIKMSTLITNVSVMLERTLGDKVTLKTDTPSDVWNCKADAGQLENALINLALNGRDSMQNGGLLNIEVSNATVATEDRHSEITAGDYVRITVSDSGTGMSPSVLAKAIDPFFTTKKAGSGLGLSMVFGFVKQSNGQLNVHSTPGEGTKVEIYLPRSTRDFQADPPESMHLEHLHIGNGQIIMLVEDDSTVREMITDSLQLLGYEVLSFSDTDLAFSTLENTEQEIDLLLTDIMLPGGSNGFQLGKLARKLRPAIKVLYMSGYADDVFTLQEQIEESVDLLQKPFRIDALAQRLAGQLDRGSSP